MASWPVSGSHALRGSFNAEFVRYPLNVNRRGGMTPPRLVMSKT
jgi:hypothetical protein